MNEYREGLKHIYRRFVLFLLAAVILTVISCGRVENQPNSDLKIKEGEKAGSKADDKTQKADLEAEVLAEQERYDLIEVVSHSDAAFLGTYLDSTVSGYTRIYRFQVNEWLYGESEEQITHVYEFIGDMEVSMSAYSYQTGRADRYTEGEEYLIIAERYSSQFTIHDEYGVSAQLYLCPAEEKYTLFDEPLSWPEEQTFQEYILALHDTYGKETEEKSEIPDDWNVYEKVKGEADFIVLVTVDAISVEHESENRLSNAYSCALQEILVGDEKKLNFFGDGSLAIVMFKDQVEVGKTYICGISPVEKTSAIYLQTSREALFSPEEKAQFTNE